MQPNVMVDGVCTVCREEPLYGTPLRLSERLTVIAAAQRASSGNRFLQCLADGCTEMALDWWYVCSTKCRDRLVESMP
jgi:hypothetical protein